MLNNILRDAYEEMNITIKDFKTYVNMDDISIEYHDFGTDFDSKEITKADINLIDNKIRVNVFTSQRHFIIGKVYNRLKICRKEAFRAYKENVEIIKHELLHSYIYNKYNEYNFKKRLSNDFLETVGRIYFYDDDNIIFVLYCMILDLKYNSDILEYEKIHNKCLEIAEQYKNCYGNNVDILNKFLELRLLDARDFVAFNDYSLANRIKNEFTGENKEVILDAINEWENRILETFEMLSILIKIDEKSA